MCCLFSDYRVNLLTDINISAKYIGMIAAVLEIVAGMASNMQNKFHKKFRNKSLSVMGISFCICMIIAALAVILKLPYLIMLTIVLFSCLVIYVDKGLYGVLVKKYLSNFTSSEILGKIYSADEIISNVIRVIISFTGSTALRFMNTSWAMLTTGIVFLICMIILLKYMETRVGLKPEEYSKSEISYQEVR